MQQWTQYIGMAIIYQLMKNQNSAFHSKHLNGHPFEAGAHESWYKPHLLELKANTSLIKKLVLKNFLNSC